MFLIEYVYLNWYFLGLVQTLVEWSDIEKQFVATFYSWVCKGLFFCQILVGIFFSFVHLSHFTWDFLYFYSFAIFNYGFSSGLFFCHIFTWNFLQLYSFATFCLGFSSAWFVIFYLWFFQLCLIATFYVWFSSALLICHRFTCDFFSFFICHLLLGNFFSLFATFYLGFLTALFATFYYEQVSPVSTCHKQ